jgi:hypothetical protein
MKTISKIAILFLFLISLSVSCNDFSPFQKTRPTEVMETALLEARTSIVGTQTALPTLTSAPTLTSTSTQTTTITPTLNSKQIFYGTSDALFTTQEAGWAATKISANTTLEARKAQCKDGFSVERPSEINTYSTDKWTLFTCSPIPSDIDDEWTPGIVDYGTRYTQVTKTDFSQTWTIQHNTFDYSAIDRPNALMQPYRWTADGKYLYLYLDIYPGRGDGWCSLSCYLPNRNELYRLSLDSGNFEVILPYTNNGYSYSLSPNDQYLAYSIPDKKIVHIRDMSNNSERQIELEGDYVLTGAFVWSTDSTKLLFASAINGWEDGTSGTSMFELTIKDIRPRTILFNDKRLLIPSPQWENGKLYYWANENLLYVSSFKIETVEYYSKLAFDMQSGEIIVLATPNPQVIGSATPKP